MNLFWCGGQKYVRLVLFNWEWKNVYMIVPPELQIYKLSKESFQYVEDVNLSENI